MKYLSTEATSIATPQLLEPFDGWPKSVHAFSEPEVYALNTALAAGRPLLVRGEPGTGKTQLARAAAERLERHLVSLTLHAHTEARDLFWTLDAVRRLSQAQIYGALGRVAGATPKGRRSKTAGADPENASNEPEAALAAEVKRVLDEANFVEPGVLWWGFSWGSAAAQEARCRGTEERKPREGVSKDAGTVLLLDEIDKADPVLPNALLEALGMGRFEGPPGCAPISKGEPEPLVVITTNEERDLPHAFVRRCAVLRLELPEGDALIELLMARGRQHGELLGDAQPSEKLLREAAEQLEAERRRYRSLGRPQPGQAEYLDLVRAVCRLKRKEKDRLELLGRLKTFVLDKHARPSDDP